MSKSRIVTKDIDRGWNRIKREIAKMDGAYVKTGIQQGEPGHDGVPMVTIAAANEFGTDSIPERSFVRSSFDENQRPYHQMMSGLASDIYRGTTTVKLALSVAGERIQADIQKKITDIRTPPNAPSTIAQKGTDNPLIDDGDLRRSIRYVVQD